MEGRLRMENIAICNANNFKIQNYFSSIVGERRELGVGDLVYLAPECVL